MYTLLSSLTSSSSSLTRTTDTGVLLTAHHRDDSAETILLKLLRGVHLTNIAGMEQAIAFPNDMPRAVVARPLLGVSKAQIQDFLTTRGLEWREDSSNASNKYKRNRVRNELIPLLSDIVGDEATLLKRLESLSQQSLELKGYLDGEAAAYVKESGTTSEQFVLPSSGTLDAVQKKALHDWSTGRMEGHAVSYHLLQRVCHQLEDYPNRLQWSLNVGKGWNIVRRGNILDVNRDNATTAANNVEETRLRWSTTGRDGGDDYSVRVRLVPPTATKEPVFLLSTAANASKWPFTPPWRSGPLKVKDFLRGQKIPLHQRPDIPMIYTTTDSEPPEKVVALLVSDKWVVDARFDAASNDDNEPTVAIHLPNP